MKWKTTNPPHVGWWLCSGDWWRWWDGKVWSFGASPGCSESTLQDAYRTPAVNQFIEWCDFWPEDALVPRLSTNPEVKKKAQNKRKQFVVVMEAAGENLERQHPVGVFEDEKNADVFLAIHQKRCPKFYYYKSWTPRFRTPE